MKPFTSYAKLLQIIIYLWKVRVKFSSKTVKRELKMQNNLHCILNEYPPLPGKQAFVMSMF